MQQQLLSHPNTSGGNRVASIQGILAHGDDTENKSKNYRKEKTTLIKCEKSQGDKNITLIKN